MCSASLESGFSASLYLVSSLLYYGGGGWGGVGVY